MILDYYTKNVYGVPTEYVADETLAQIIRELTGKKTINLETRRLLEKFGVSSIEVIQPR